MVSLVRAKADSEALLARERPVTNVFHPRFTYPVRSKTPSPPFWRRNLTTKLQIFGEQEKIYGYENLRIDVSTCSSFLPIEYVLDASIQLGFASGSLRQYLAIEHTAKIPDTTIDNPEKQLYDFIPPGRLVGLKYGRKH